MERERDQHPATVTDAATDPVPAPSADPAADPRRPGTETEDGSRQVVGRGRAAWRPGGIPRAGWRDILWRVQRRIGRDYVPLMSAGVAFFGLLALFPGLATLAALAAMVFEPDLVVQQVEGLGGIAPAEPLEIVRAQAAALAEQTAGQAGTTALISLAVSLFWASRGVWNLIDGINMAHAESETRGFVFRNLVALGLTLVLALLGLVAIALAVAVPAAAAFLGLGGFTDTILTWGRWPVLAVLAMLALAIVYRYAPSRRPPRWSWVTPGAVLATAVWLGGSLLFSWFVGNFGSYNPTYGAIAGVVILLLWMWLTSFIVLVGAQINAEMEHQTRRDTTRGKVRPMGRRDAYMADTLGKSP